MIMYSVEYLIEYSSTQLTSEVDSDYRVVQNKRTSDCLLQYFSS